MSDFDASSIAELPKTKIAVFLLSTYGEGAPSDNAGPFWDWLTKLRSSSDKPALASLRYAVFGLGNSRYRHYNRVGNVVDTALGKAGAERLLSMGRADDANGATIEDFAAWRNELFEFLVSGLGLEQHEARYEPQFKVQPGDPMSLSELQLGKPIQDTERKVDISSSRDNSVIKPIKIKSARELFNDSTRSCLHLELDLTNHPQITYKTGDHLTVWAVNPNEEVERLLRVLGLTKRREESVLVRALNPSVTKIPVPSPSTIETILRYYLEICAPVARDTIRALAEFAPGPAAKAFILDLSDSRKKYADFVAANHLTFGRLLDMAAQQTGQDDSWSTLPLAFLIEALPRMQPRYYSISSSSVLTPRTATLTVSISSTVLSTADQVIPGLASNYLLGVSLSPPLSLSDTPHPANLSYSLAGPDSALVNGCIYASIHRSRFKLPASSACPIIMVAAGTGIAPFRAFVAERARLAAMGRDIGEMMLFFGCRSPDEDNIYFDELEAARAQLGSQRFRLVAAFSRADVDGVKKGYVQDQVVQEGERVVRLLIEGDASFYVCGRASMAREVGRKVEGVVGKEQGWDEEMVKAWMEGMKRTRKWKEDVWG